MHIAQSHSERVSILPDTVKELNSLSSSQSQHGDAAFGAVWKNVSYLVMLLSEHHPNTILTISEQK